MSGSQRAPLAIDSTSVLLGYAHCINETGPVSACRVFAGAPSKSGPPQGGGVSMQRTAFPCGVLCHAADVEVGSHAPQSLTVRHADAFTQCPTSTFPKWKGPRRADTRALASCT